MYTSTDRSFWTFSWRDSSCICVNRQWLTFLSCSAHEWCVRMHNLNTWHYFVLTHRTLLLRRRPFKLVSNRYTSCFIESCFQLYSINRPVLCIRFRVDKLTWWVLGARALFPSREHHSWPHLKARRTTFEPYNKIMCRRHNKNHG